MQQARTDPSSRPADRASGAAPPALRDAVPRQAGGEQAARPSAGGTTTSAAGPALVAAPPPPALALGDHGPALRRDLLDAVIFDMDGVVTDTASVHGEAWKRLFDTFLAEWARRRGEPFVPFSIEHDYRRYVDGKPRNAGVADFLASRGITLPLGEPDDPADRETVCGLASRKNGYFLAHIETAGVKAFSSTVDFIAQLHAQGISAGIISASRNAEPVLAAAGVRDIFEVKVDGTDAAALGLPGKPDPAVFLEAARQLGVPPGRAAVVEDALAGVQAGRAGGFAVVVGVDRLSHPDALLAGGADVVVADLAGLSVEPAGVPAPAGPSEHALPVTEDPIR